MLKGFLLSRSPTRGFAQSNGHGRRQEGRAVVSRQGNLVVEPKRIVPVNELRELLRAEAKRQGKLYGLSFRDISGGFTNTQRGGPQAFKVLPILVYRVWVDGRPDELVRGVDLVGTPLAALSRIIAASDDYQTFNGYCGAESGFVPVSATSPSLLVQQIEVERRDKGNDKPPLLPAPALVRPQAPRLDGGGAVIARRWLGASVVLVLLVVLAGATGAAADSLAKPADAAPAVRVNAASVKQAMEDELARSMKELRMGDDEPHPYYIAYTVSDVDQATTSATLGAVTAAHAYRGRLLRTEVRVGDANFDNSNFEGGASVEAIPIEDDYAALRRELWLRSDEAYKSAVETLARKRSAASGQASAPTRTTASPTSRRRRPRTSRFRSPAPPPIRRRCARPCASCRCCWRRFPRSTDRTSSERPRSSAGGWRPARGRGSTTTSARSASTSSPTRRPTTA